VAEKRRSPLLVEQRAAPDIAWIARLGAAAADGYGRRSRSTCARRMRSRRTPRACPADDRYRHQSVCRARIDASEASCARRRAIARLHGASFHRGWSDGEIEQMIRDRNVWRIAQLLDAACGLHPVAAHRARRRFSRSRSPSAQRGKGLARRLLDLHLRRLAGLGARAVFLEVDEGNVPALKLYRRAGFREVGRRAGYYQSNQGSRRAGAAARSCVTTVMSLPDGFAPSAMIFRIARRSVVSAPKPRETKISRRSAPPSGMRMTEQRRVIARVLAAARITQTSRSSTGAARRSTTASRSRPSTAP
jgi:ribosomal-protein-alanine N-acetyltransferase